MLIRVSAGLAMNPVLTALHPTLLAAASAPAASPPRSIKPASASAAASSVTSLAPLPASPTTAGSPQPPSGQPSPAAAPPTPGQALFQLSSNGARRILLFVAETLRAFLATRANLVTLTASARAKRGPSADVSAAAAAGRLQPPDLIRFHRGLSERLRELQDAQHVTRVRPLLGDVTCWRAVVVPDTGHVVLEGAAAASVSHARPGSASNINAKPPGGKASCALGIWALGYAETARELMGCAEAKAFLDAAASASDTPVCGRHHLALFPGVRRFTAGTLRVCLRAVPPGGAASPSLPASDLEAAAAIPLAGLAFAVGGQAQWWVAALALPALDRLVVGRVAAAPGGTSPRFVALHSITVAAPHHPAVAGSPNATVTTPASGGRATPPAATTPGWRDLAVEIVGRQLVVRIDGTEALRTMLPPCWLPASLPGLASERGRGRRGRGGRGGRGVAGRPDDKPAALVGLWTQDTASTAVAPARGESKAAHAAAAAEARVQFEGLAVAASDSLLLREDVAPLAASAGGAASRGDESVLTNIAAADLAGVAVRAETAIGLRKVTLAETVGTLARENCRRFFEVEREEGKTCLRNMRGPRVCRFVDLA